MNENRKPYIILSQPAIYLLEGEVERGMQDGYVPTGGVFFSGGVVMQAMVLAEVSAIMTSEDAMDFTYSRR